MGAWAVISPNAVGAQPIDETSSAALHPIGQIIQAKHATFGVGEFIYLKGVASTVVGSVVTFNSTTGTTALAAVGNNRTNPVAVAMAATTAALWGWYQIAGQATAVKTATVSLAANAGVGVLTIGKAAGTGSGKEIQGAVVVTAVTAASARTSVLVLVNRPTMQGRVT